MRIEQLPRRYSRLIQLTPDYQARFQHKSFPLIREQVRRFGPSQSTVPDAPPRVTRASIWTLDAAAPIRSPAVAPLVAVSAGCALLHVWDLAGLALVLLGIVALLRTATYERWPETLSTVVGVSLYLGTLYFVWTLSNSAPAAGVPALLGGPVLVFFSFGLWVSSVFLEGLGGWMSRAAAGLTLAAAVFMLGSLPLGFG